LSLCSEIATVRQFCQTIDAKRLLFLDETAIRISEAPRTTLVAPGEKQFVIVNDSSSYAGRYDMIACISGEKAFPPAIFSPNDRKQLKVKGIRQFMLLDYIHNTLAPAVRALRIRPLYLYLFMDKSRTHNRKKILDEFQSSGCTEIIDVQILPSKSSKRISPLDNSFFAEFKQKVRQNSPLAETNIKSIMMNSYQSISKQHINSYYRHCALLPSVNVYHDCPRPTQHKH
jgi:hypothetical protein